MAVWKRVCLCVALGMLTVALLGCAAAPSADETRKYADGMTENMLTAMNEDDYGRFSRDFDDKMRAGLNETGYRNTIPAIKAKIGKYVSKEFVAVEKKDGFIVATYRAKFTQEPGAVTVRSVFSESNGRKQVSGFWLDSPKLRGN